mmetsp:Transcript_8257/g.23544  ORF Transcript_8257/g.23544 Transcript_8257/m.23544 type:complete len:236 (-) Transcript_8257:964-1671(-)
MLMRRCSATARSRSAAVRFARFVSCSMLAVSALTSARSLALRLSSRPSPSSRAMSASRRPACTSRCPAVRTPLAPTPLRPLTPGRRRFFPMFKNDAFAKAVFCRRSLPLPPPLLLRRGSTFAMRWRRGTSTSEGLMPWFLAADWAQCATSRTPQRAGSLPSSKVDMPAFAPRRFSEPSPPWQLCSLKSRRLLNLSWQLGQVKNSGLAPSRAAWMPSSMQMAITTSLELTCCLASR